MRFGAITLIGIVAILASIETASARDGCGRGLAWNGYACVQDPYSAPPPPPPGYGGGGYGGGGYGGYGGGYPRPGYGGGYGGHGLPPQLQTNRAQDCYTVHGRRICCPKNWTVQDGVCKPYTGR